MSKSFLKSCHCHFLLLNQNRSMKTKPNLESYNKQSFQEACNGTDAISLVNKTVLLKLSCSLLYGHGATTARHTG